MAERAGARRRHARSRNNLISLAWVLIAGPSRVAPPILTLVASGLVYALMAILLSAVLSPILTGELQGPLAMPLAIVPMLLTNALWGFLAGVLARVVQRMRGMRSGALSQ